MIYSSVRWKSFCVYCYLSTIPHSKGNTPDGYGFSLIGISPFWGSLRTAPIAWVCGWTEVSLYSLPVIALITVPCNVQVLKAAAFACVARPLRDSRKNVSDVLYIQLSKCFENFFTSHLYSRNFRVLITKDFTFFHFLLFTQFLKTIFSDYSDNWFMTGEFFHKTTVWFSFPKKFDTHLQIVLARKEKMYRIAVCLTVKYFGRIFLLLILWMSKSEKCTKIKTITSKWVKMEILTNQINSKELLSYE